MFINKTEFFSKCRNKLLYLYLTPKNFKVLADQKVKFPVTPPYILWEKCPKEWGGVYRSVYCILKWEKTPDCLENSYANSVLRLSELFPLLVSHLVTVSKVHSYSDLSILFSAEDHLLLDL